MASSGFFPLRGRGAVGPYLCKLMTPELCLVTWPWGRRVGRARDWQRWSVEGKGEILPNFFSPHHCKDYIFYAEEIFFFCFHSPSINKCYNKLLLNLLQLKIDKYVFHTKIQRSDLTNCIVIQKCVKFRILHKHYVLSSWIHTSMALLCWYKCLKML